MKNWRRRTGTVLLTAVLGTAGLGFAATPAIAQNAPQEQPAADKQLDKKDRELVEQAAREGKPTVDLLVAAEKGKTDAAVNELKALGATVQKTEKDVDYVKVTIPRENAERAAKLASVNTVDVDGLIAVDDPRPQGMENPAPQKAPDSKTPRTNPYMPTQDTQAAQFATANPKWDGRGATIAVIDGGIDLDTPALQTTSTGERKIIDWYNANSIDSGDGTWVAMTKTGRVGKFTAEGREWTAPSTGGPYSFGLFRETAGDLSAAASEVGGDINRDGDRTDSFGVIQDITTKEVFVDSDGDGNFTNNKRMIDYKVKYDVGFFGTDNPATPVVDRIAFVVQTDRSIYDNAGTPYVNLGISGAHGTHVAGITAAHKLFDGKAAGAAPGAKLISIKACLTTPACTSSGLIDGVLYAARNGADVVNISIGGLPALNDGNNARAELYNRTINEYNVQLFISAGNSGAGANTVGDPSVATDAVSVGSSITKETWLSNYGSKTKQKQSLHGFSSRGPAEDGGFKPNIIAPGSAISTTPRWQPGGPVTGTYTLPAGYSMFNGTSMAAPQATGAAALLVSAFKATHNGQRPTSAELRYAIQRSANYVKDLAAYEQGAGLFNTNAAWKLLDKHSVPDQVTTSVPVSTVLGDFLATPNTGVGIHDREGVTAGKEYTRTYTLTRTTGHKDETYNVSWLGNDGTFTAPKKVSLPLNKPVKLDVKVKPKTAGAHSAVLQLDNPETPGVDVQTLNTVFAAETFNSANKFSVTKTGKIERNQSASIFVNVPKGTSALKVDMAAGGAEAGKGQVRFLRYTPQGIPFDSSSSTNCYNPDAGAGCAGGTPTSRTVTNPMAGVWEIVIESRRTSDAAESAYSVTASVLGTTVSPNPDVIPSASLGTPIERSYTVTNSQAGFTGKLAAGQVGSAKQDRPTIANLESKQIPVTVGAGATRLTATIGNPSDQGADLDLLVYNCTTGSCLLAGQSADADSEESVTINNPAAGQWIVLVDAYSVPAGTTEYDYFDVFTSPGLGTLTVADSDAERAAGSSWSTTAVITPLGVPAAGRVLRGDLEVRTVDGALVGGGAVIIQSIG
ncbi:Subtilase family protein [Lentzea fradiae]|uniref:Subtilase family protein n=1 Tax=Lentzea fradiae TaxID=200378 RepID=A0A1G7Q8W0_9PSEU|nr:S8 family serine peptidase [Lentzea fradiae]SDF94895.1 Subtilase family protein [Lentzea fradiae]